MNPEGARLTLDGVEVPAGDYEHVKRLADIVFGLTAVDEPADKARAASVRIAMDLLRTARVAVAIERTR